MFDDRERQAGAVVASAALGFIRSMPMPAFLGDEERNIYLANQAMADAFGYESVEALEESIKRPSFLASHFPPDVIAQLFEMLYKQGRVDGWLIRGQSVSGRDFTFEITAQAKLRGAQGPAYYFEAVFVTPGSTRDAEAFLCKARKEAELASNAKTEFLSNISHEFKTPLNIIIGMLGLAVDDSSLNEELKQNLMLAKEAADGLAVILDDLIILSNLEARRLTSDISPFSPGMLMKTLALQFEARAAEKNIELLVNEDENSSAIVEGGYNLILLALEKLVDNAIKFTDSGGRVVVSASVETREDGPWLLGRVADNGPGLPPNILDSDKLLVQGDGSKNRRFGGLGLGLSIVGNILSTLGGNLTHLAPQGGGTDLTFQLPVKYTEMVDSGGN